GRARPREGARAPERPHLGGGRPRDGPRQLGGPARRARPRARARDREVPGGGADGHAPHQAAPPRVVPHGSPRGHRPRRRRPDGVPALVGDGGSEPGVGRETGGAIPRSGTPGVERPSGPARRRPGWLSGAACLPTIPTGRGSSPAPPTTPP